MEKTSSPSCNRSCRVWPVIAGILAFGALMALRYELSSVWLRALTAGLAFAILGLGIWFQRKG
jgi:hypothetical protein